MFVDISTHLDHHTRHKYLLLFAKKKNTYAYKNQY